MPQLIEQPAPVVAVQRLVVLIQVRHIVHQRVEPLLIWPCDTAAGRILDLAEIAGEGDLLVVGDVLVVEHQDRATIHPRLDRPDLVARRGRPQIDARYLADENGVHLANRDRHRTDS